ncbi:hypothetical protein ACN4EG_24060 [Alkalinema pantanalense CENA528]|uniref:hypothetical protein n=1 Tax=Alkalinema pantanalense TaxID=1620705 RepID=UPI003D6E307F
MTDLMTQLAARTLDRTPLVQPRIDSMFAPPFTTATVITAGTDNPAVTDHSANSSSDYATATATDPLSSPSTFPLTSPSLPLSPGETLLEGGQDFSRSVSRSALVDPTAPTLPIAHLPRWTTPPTTQTLDERSQAMPSVPSSSETAKVETFSSAISAAPVPVEGMTGMETTGMETTGMEPVGVDRVTPQQAPPIAPISSPTPLHPASTFTDSIVPTHTINADSLRPPSNFSSEPAQQIESSQPSEPSRSMQNSGFVQPTEAMESFSEHSTALTPNPLSQSSSPISRQSSSETPLDAPLVPAVQPSTLPSSASNYLTDQLTNSSESNFVNPPLNHQSSNSFNPISTDIASHSSSNLSDIPVINSASHPLSFTNNDVSPTETINLETIKASLPTIQRFSETGSNSTVSPVTIDAGIGAETVPQPSMTIGDASIVHPLPTVGESTKAESRLDARSVFSESLTVPLSTVLPPSTIEPVISSNFVPSNPPLSDPIAQPLSSSATIQNPVNRESSIVPASDASSSRAEPLVQSLTQVSPRRSNDSSNQRENSQTYPTPLIVHAEINGQTDTRLNAQSHTQLNAKSNHSSNPRSNSDQLISSQSLPISQPIVPIPVIPTLVPKVAVAPPPEAMPNSPSSAGRQAGMNPPESALESSAPTIHITIGRIDIRAIPQASPPARSRPAANPPKQSLQDYLNHRNGGGG